MLKVVKRPLAKIDIKKIWRYTCDKWGEQQADAYIYNLGHAIESIADNPKIGVNIEYVRQGYRIYHYQRHLVIYRPTLTTIEIVRVLGERMDIKRHLINQSL